MFATFCNSLSCEEIVTVFPLHICIKFLQFHNMELAYVNFKQLTLNEINFT